jgi:hypothetical protein
LDAGLLQPLPVSAPWPKPNCPAITASTSFSKTTRADWFARTRPLRSQSMYAGTRMTPCESWPTRSASTRCRAMVRASASDEPAREKIMLTSHSTASCW